MDAVSISTAFVDELARVNRKLRTLFNARAKDQGLTYARARLLLHLAQQDGATQVELADLVEVEQPTMVKLLDGLERQGLIERRPVEGDRRAKCIVLTEAARAQADDVLAITADLRARVLQNIEEADLVAATRVLRRIAENIGAAS